MREGGPVLESGDQAAESRNPAVERFLWFSLVAILVGVTSVSFWKIRTAAPKAGKPSPAPTLPALGEEPVFVPDFSLVDQRANPVTLADLKGQVWVANFFFTSCRLAVCPMMTKRMEQIQKALPEGAAVKLVSITVDPERDSPEVLAGYAATYGAKEDRWLFLTGNKGAILRLAREGFRLPAGEDPNDHSTRLVLVDRAGRICGYYSYNEDASVAELQRQLRALLDKE